MKLPMFGCVWRRGMPNGNLTNNGRVNLHSVVYDMSKTGGIGSTIGDTATRLAEYGRTVGSTCGFTFSGELGSASMEKVRALV